MATTHCEAVTMATLPPFLMLLEKYDLRACAWAVKVCADLCGESDLRGFMQTSNPQEIMSRGRKSQSSICHMKPHVLNSACFINSLTRASPLCWQPKCPCPGCPRSRLWSRSTCKRRQIQCHETHPVLNKSTPAELILATLLAACLQPNYQHDERRIFMQ